MPRACIILPDSACDSWLASGLRSGVGAVAAELMQAGWEVLLLDPQLPLAAHTTDASGMQRCGLGDDGVPLVAGPGSGSGTAALRDGCRIAQRLRGESPDLVLAPLWRGIAQPLLMMRATGEALLNATVAVWADRLTSARLHENDALIMDVGPLVDDALERSVLRLADAVIACSAEALDALRRLTPVCGSARALSLPPLPAHRPPTDARLAGAEIGEIVFVGPLTRRHGALRFLDAIEDLAREHRLGGRCVSFLGPVREDCAGLGKTLLGVRAQHWDFAFKMVDVATMEQALEYLQAPHMLAVFAGDAPEDARLAAALARSGIATLLATSGIGSAEGDDCFRDALSAAIEGRQLFTPPPPRPPEWPALLRELCVRPASVRTLAATLRPSVCIVHHDRPALLRRALDSVDASGLAPQIVLLDNASRSAGSAELLRQFETQKPGNMQLIRGQRLLPQSRACDAAARAADGDLLVFLDDDNAFTPGGLRRLVEAFGSGNFDVVVSCLDLYDGDFSAAAPDARLVFLGDAGSAGLFFNGFGDTAMAFRREDFHRIGGFSADGYSGPAPDWVLLARARAAGLRIGVLQTPAFKYARNLGAGLRSWRKLDQEGARSEVLRSYPACIDAGLVGRLAQGATLQLFLG